MQRQYRCTFFRWKLMFVRIPFLLQPAYDRSSTWGKWGTDCRATWWALYMARTFRSWKGSTASPVAVSNFITGKVYTVDNDLVWCGQELKWLTSLLRALGGKVVHTRCQYMIAYCFFCDVFVVPSHTTESIGLPCWMNWTSQKRPPIKKFSEIFWGKMDWTVTSPPPGCSPRWPPSECWRWWAFKVFRVFCFGFALLFCFSVSFFTRM